MTRFFMAGNFVNLIYPHKERKTKEVINSLGYDYKRLISFWDSHRMSNILEFKREIQEGKLKPKGVADESELEKFKRIHKESKNWNSE